MAVADLPTDLLRTFVVIADTGSFSRAAQRLYRSQSAVSLQLKRLEALVDQRLFERSPKRVEITPGGRTLLPFARRMLDLNDAALSAFSGAPLKGVVRFGAPEDFATTYLPGVLSRFAATYPDVALEVTCDLTLNLIDAFRDGALDLVLVKREPAGVLGARARDVASGLQVWREALVWVGGPAPPPDRAAPLPLVLSPRPCVYRKRATDALDAAGRPWRIAYSCASLAGVQAAIRAGLGVSVLPRDMTPADLTVLDAAAFGLPALRETEIALIEAPHPPAPAARLRDEIARELTGTGA